MSISATDAKSVLHEAHSAWSEGDVEGTLAYYMARPRLSWFGGELMHAKDRPRWPAG